jgi:integrase
MGLISRAPVGEIDRLPEREKDQRYRRRAMSESEITRFLTAAQDDDRRNAKRHAYGQVYGSAGLRRIPRVPQTPLWRALIETGARWSELTRCNWADVDLHGRVLTLRAANTKAGKTRRVPLLEGLVADLVRLRAFGGGAEDRVFLAPGCVPWGRPTTNAMRIFNRVLERAGIARVDDQGRKLDIHALRTTCGSRMARNGAGIVHTQQLLGHSSITLTERHYTDLGVEEIRAAMQAMPATGEGLKGVG